MNQQIADSNGLNTTKPEKCQVCLKSFKSARGVRIHQGKSGCKTALGHNRFVKSKPVVGDIREPHHSDFSYTNKPEEVASTSSIEDLSTCSESKKGGEITLTQEITSKLRELRKECEILIIDDKVEEDIQLSILAEEAKFTEFTSEDAKATDVTAESDDDLVELMNRIEEVENYDVPEISGNSLEREFEQGTNIEGTVHEILESDEETIGIEDIECIEEFTKIVEVSEQPRKQILQRMPSKKTQEACQEHPQRPEGLAPMD